MEHDYPKAVANGNNCAIPNRELLYGRWAEASVIEILAWKPPKPLAPCKRKALYEQR